MREGSLVLLGLKVTEEQVERRDQKVHLETMAQEVFLVLSAHPDPMDPAVKREKLDLKALLDLMDQERCLETVVNLVLLVLLGLVGHPVLMVNQESRESPESQVRRVTLVHQGLRAYLDPTDLLVLLVWLD